MITRNFYLSDALMNSYLCLISGKACYGLGIPMLQFIKLLATSELNEGWLMLAKVMDCCSAVELPLSRWFIMVAY